MPSELDECAKTPSSKTMQRQGRKKYVQRARQRDCVQKARTVTAKEGKHNWSGRRHDNYYGFSKFEKYGTER